MTFIIQDWAGNHLFQHLTFPTFDDAWSFLQVHFAKEAEEDEQFLGEFYVEETVCGNQKE